MVQIKARSVGLGLYFPRADFVQLRVNVLQLLSIGGMKVAAASCGSNADQRLLIQLFFTRCGGITNSDDVNCDAMVSGYRRRLRCSTKTDLRPSFL